MEKIKLNLGELFSGPGGLAYGAINSSLEYGGTHYSYGHAWSNDIDHDSCQTYIMNIPGAHSGNVYCEDIALLNIDNLSSIDIFAYGFPCNDFSIIGKQKGFDGTYGPLYKYGINVINKFKPKFFIAENVGGIRSANDGEAFKKILNDLSNSGDGYDIVSHLYKAEEYGIAQTRHRVIIVGIQKSLELKYRVPAQTTKNNYIPVSKVLESIPFDAPNNEFTNQSKKVIERLKYISPGENVWTSKMPEHLRLNVENVKLSQIYKRLHPDKPSYTITGSGGGGTHGYHYYENRALTNRERAAIQSFPNDYAFFGAKESVRKQIGMAVPPALSKIIFESILKTYAKCPYLFIESNIGNT